MVEVWKNINSNYLISNLGNCKSLKTPNGRASNKSYEKILKPQKRCSYLAFNIDGKSQSIHRLVAIAFIPNPLNKPCVDHIDHNKLNNNVSNLRWVTIEENNKHRYDCGRANQYTLYGQKNKPYLI